jgi:rSAM/selenodomain-associated transferase 1
VTVQPRLLVLMARAPAPLRCKSRLAAGGLGPRPAALVQGRLLAHTLAVLDRAGDQLDARSRLALTGVGRRSARRLLGRSGRTELVSQGGGGLGLRLQRQCARGFAQGHRAIVLVGSDLPQLAAVDLQQAFAALQQVPLVLGPADDGGYWLIGLRAPAAPLFAGIDWGGPQVLAQTLAQAERLNLSYSLLDCQGDLDRVADLACWR